MARTRKQRNRIRRKWARKRKTSKKLTKKIERVIFKKAELKRQIQTMQSKLVGLTTGSGFKWNRLWIVGEPIVAGTDALQYGTYPTANFAGRIGNEITARYMQLKFLMTQIITGTVNDMGNNYADMLSINPMYSRIMILKPPKGKDVDDVINYMEAEGGWLSIADPEYAHNPMFVDVVYDKWVQTNPYRKTHIINFKKRLNFKIKYNSSTSASPIWSYIVYVVNRNDPVSGGGAYNSLYLNGSLKFWYKDV